MLTQQHIDEYAADLLRAQRKSLDEILLAERVAFRVLCHGCAYCQTAVKHRKILESTTAELLLIIGSLHPGAAPTMSFPKKMFPGTAIYRGFILDTGEYVDMFNTEHGNYRMSYARKHGMNRAYKMITVHGYGMRTQVQFFDRKYTPNVAQYATLRELMIDAQGALTFSFSYGTNHPAM